MKTDNWKKVKGYEEQYLINNDGEVYSLLSNKVLKPNYMTTGYLSVELFKNGKRKRCSIHRLVAEAFIDNPDNLPCVNHKDENKQNNNVENLEWCTYKYNSNYGTCKEKIKKNRVISDKLRNSIRATGLKNAKPVIQLTKDNVVINRFDSIMKAAEALNIDHGHISSVCKNKRKTAGGYKWKYEREVC